MSLDVYLSDPTATYQVEDLYTANITHNLVDMAFEADLYEALWRPHRLHDDYSNDIPFKEELEFESKHNIKAKDIIDKVEKGLTRLKANPKKYKEYDSYNGWGTYEDFVPFVEKYLEALKKYPEAIVKISR